MSARHTTPLDELLGPGAAGCRAAVRAAGHLADGEWRLRGPLAAATSASVRCAGCGELLRAAPDSLEMPARCVGPRPGRWR